MRTAQGAPLEACTGQPSPAMGSGSLPKGRLGLPGCVVPCPREPDTRRSAACSVLLGPDEASEGRLATSCMASPAGQQPALPGSQGAGLRSTQLRQAPPWPQIVCLLHVEAQGRPASGCEG